MIEPLAAKYNLSKENKPSAGSNLFFKVNQNRFAGSDLLPKK